jgi:hypothetical protein
MVPLIPDILLINATEKLLGQQKYAFTATAEKLYSIKGHFAITFAKN